MSQIAVLKRLTIVQKPLTECLFQIPENSNMPFLIPIPKPLESLEILAEDEKQEEGITDSDEETQKID